MKIRMMAPRHCLGVRPPIFHDEASTRVKKIFLW